MKKVLVDINVVLDVLLDRQPHAAGSALVWAAVENGVTLGLVAAHAIPTIHYLVRKERGEAQARRIVATILRVFGVATVDAVVLQEALQLSSPDFEDAVTASAARFADCDLIVTRDPKGFRGAPVLPVTPEAAVPLLTRE